MTHWINHLPDDRLLAEISLWSADLLHMAQEMDRLDDYTDVYHVDASDGHFTPSFLLFPDQVAAIRAHTKKPIHVHLMAHESVVLAQIEQFADAGADLISVHGENANAQEAIEAIQRRELEAGLVLCVETDVDHIKDHLPNVSFITLLGTRIGVKGQGLDPAAPARMQQARQLIDEADHAHRIVLAADGGIREHTVPQLRSSGADTVVMGSLAFNDPDLDARMQWIRAMPR